MLRRAVLVSVLTIITAAGSSLLVKNLLLSQRRGRTAFTATETKRMYDETQLRWTWENVYAVRSDGSKSITRSMPDPNGQIKEQVEIQDVESGQRTIVDEMTGSLSTTVMGEKAVSDLRMRPGRCTDNPQAERRKVLGYEVVKFMANEVTVPSETGSFRLITEVWSAPALNCFPLKRTELVDLNDGSPLHVTNTYEVTSIVLGKPDDSEFAIPTDYVERSPSEMLGEYSRRYPNPPISSYIWEAQPELDAAYLAQQE